MGSASSVGSCPGADGPVFLQMLSRKGKVKKRNAILGIRDPSSGFVSRMTSISSVEKVQVDQLQIRSKRQWLKRSTYLELGP
jgi:hypothetical protein